MTVIRSRFSFFLRNARGVWEIHSATVDAIDLVTFEAEVVS